MKSFFVLLVLLTSITSCSDFQKAIKNEDVATKYKLGEELYNAGIYSKANRLFAQIVPSYKGKPQAEKLMYMYASSFYKMGYYDTSSYQFERFATSYPKSEKAEEALFYSAKSYYELSPAYTTDQTKTKEAIEKLQNFLNTYPNSQYANDANKLVQELDFKLEEKAFEIARQYNTISDYKAAIHSFDNFIIDFPGSKLREDALFYRLDSAYNLAINSVEYLKEERLNTANDYCQAFKRKYSDSQFTKSVNEMDLIINKSLKTYNKQS